MSAATATAQPTTAPPAQPTTEQPNGYPTEQPTTAQPAQPNGYPTEQPNGYPPAPAREETARVGRLVLEGQVGLGMPLGAVALEASYRASGLLSLSAGLGQSMYGHTQVGVMPRLHLLQISDGLILLSVGAGLSYGDYEQNSVLDTFGSDEFVPNTTWASVELAFTIQAGSLAIRGFSGFSRTISLGEDGDMFTSAEYFEIPYLGLGAGYTF